jgi:hypothetical protein
MRFDFTFPRNYDVKVLPSAPPVHPIEKRHHYPIELEEGEGPVLYLRILPQRGPAWFGMFASGFDSAQVMNAVMSCPDPDCLCVIAGGYAYVVNASHPEHWFRIEQAPVVEFITVVSKQLILFAGFTSVTALGREGIAWRTGRLSWEGVSMTRVDEHVLHGTGWDALSDKECRFEVDLQTGKHIGGAAPGAGGGAG